jgi:Domain of unknown function (DUF4357)
LPDLPPSTILLGDVKPLAPDGHCLRFLGHDEDMLDMSDLRPSSIHLFLADGRPDGLRLVEKSNWTGLGLVTSRSDYTRVRRRDEWSRPGVYLLIGPTEGETTKDMLYIGEADDVRDRLDHHIRNKEFWTSVIAFTSKDDNLNKAHVRYLEARLIQVAAEADRVAVENSTAPPLPRLSEADRADMEGYLAEMLVILPVLGVVAFESVARTAPAADSLRLMAKRCDATGADGSEGFTVFAGSVARLDETPSIHAFLTALRQRLIDEAVLHPDGGGLRFAKPYVFASPSTAAGVVTGRNANGLIMWKDSAGRTLKERQEAALGS